MSRSSYSSSSSSSSKSPMQTCVDPLDIDSFINYEAMSYQSPSPSSTRAQMMGRPTSATANPNNTLLPPSSNSNFTQTFSGPSHQYESYKQQTGLPSGALPNTLAVNPPNNMNMFRGSAFSNAEFGLNTTDDLLDFGTMPVADTEMEFDMPPMFFPNDQNTADFIDPSTLGENQEQFNVPAIKVSPSQTNNIGRLYPGAHKQQAALAQAQQEQSKQEQQSGRSRRAAGTQPTDPIVEEKISQLLKSMRQNSASTMSDDDDSTPNANGHSHMARMRKDEEDMDEDERLLASEEGKKLSSKERRQLRNKVSARAFRSRRKEYIGQLEAEIATKVNEADDLKMTNRALMEENTRLTDLTRMLLSSPAFSTFLDNMSTEGVQTTSGPQQTPTPQQQQSTNVKPNVRKDVNPYNAAQQQVQKEEPSDAQIGMALLPETTMDFSLLNGNVGGSWTTWGANQPQVFSVLEIPEGPAVDRFDSGVLSGKSRSTESIFESTSSKVEAPMIERMPTIEADAPAIPVEVHDCDWDESDPAFALFVDTPEPLKSNSQQLAHEDFVDMFGGKSLEQVFARLDLVSATEESQADKAVSAASMEKLQAVCDSIESPMQRIARMTSHL